MDIKRRAKERRIAELIALELNRVLGPVLPEMLAVRNDTVCGIFSAAFDSHRVVDEASAERILHFVPAYLATLNESFATLNAKLDAAIRQQRLAPCQPGAPSR
jgi:hypothetical protein